MNSVSLAGNGELPIVGSTDQKKKHQVMMFYPQTLRMDIPRLALSIALSIAASPGTLPCQRTQRIGEIEKQHVTTY